MEKQQKVLDVIIGSLELGGAEYHLTQILPQLAKRGWDITVITLGSKGVLAPMLECANIKILSFPSFRWLSLIPTPFRTLVKCCLNIIRIYKRCLSQRNANNTIIHFFLPMAYILGMVAAILSNFQGIKIMSRRSLNHYQKKYFGMRWIEKYLHRKCNIILGNSLAIIEQLNKDEGVEKEKLRLIYNGIDLSRFDQDFNRKKIRTALGLQESTFVIIIIANLIPYKGHQDLLYALEKIKEDFLTDWKLLCVGRDDGILIALQEQANQLGIQENIDWLGSRTDIPELLAIADLSVNCSHEEGFSNAILESMAAGLPLVVTDVGGNAEAVVHSQTGLVIPTKNIHALSEAILYCHKQPELMQNYGKAAKQRVFENFSLDKCIDNYNQLYNSFLHENISF